MEFSTTINASRQKVWEALWGDDTYPLWTTPFSPGSIAVTDWKKGSKVLFLDKEKQAGMVSFIEESIPYEFISFRHEGFVKDGVEDFESEEVKKWSGSYENYTLTDVNGKTHIFVAMTDSGIPEEHREFFMNAWPEALNILKEISEAK